MMGDMDDVYSAKSPMSRAMPLFLQINKWRRRMEQQEPEIRPGRGRGAWGLVQDREERTPGRRGTTFFREGQDLTCSSNTAHSTTTPHPALLFDTR